MHPSKPIQTSLPLALRLAPILAATLALSGCRNTASEKLVQRAISPQAGPARAGLDKVRGATFKDFGISGRDRQLRPAWSLHSREARVGAGQNPASPARASLLGARAELFRDGVLESSFQAERIELVTASVPAPGGKKRTIQRLELSGGVRAQSIPPASLLRQNPGSRPGLSRPRLTSAPVTLEAPSVVVNLSDKTVWVPASAVVKQKESGVSISAHTLRGDSGLQRLDMGGSVEANSSAGRVRADRASYSWKARRLLALGHVQAQAPVAIPGQAPSNLLLSGERLEADAAGESGLLSGGVRAQLAGGQSGAASAAQIRFSWRERSVRALGGVSFEKDGASIKAGEVATDADFSQATASGSVRFKSRDGAEITAERVRAFDKFSRAIASGGVRLAASTSQGLTTVSAAQVEAFDDFTRATASGGVVLKQGAATIRARNVEAFDLKGAGRAVADGGVEIVRDDLTINAGRAEASNLRQKDGFKVAASQGVRARNKDGLVGCERVSWAGGRVEASGGVTLRVVLQQGESMLAGDKLSGDDKFENALLTGHVRGKLPEGGSLSAGRIEKAGPKIIATGGVQARQGGVSLRMARLESTITRSDVLGSGGVVLTTSDGATLSAPRARYSKARDEAYAEDGARYVDAKQGQDIGGSRVLVRHVSDRNRREAIINDVGGSASQKALRGFKL